jgi:hypothetical protein
MTTTTVLLCGYGGAGKDSVRKILQKQHDFEGEAFADKVRETAVILNPYFPETQCTYNELLVLEGGYEAAKRKYKCLRAFLVKIGHDLKHVFGEDIWIKLLRGKVAAAHYRNKSVCVSDCRNLVEALAFPDAQVWYIHRPGVGPADDTEAKTIPLLLDAIDKTRLVRVNNDADLDHLAKVVGFLRKDFTSADN